MKVLGIGEILWDVFPDKERLGGAALNFCANIARLGDSAALITAVGNDARGRAALEGMEQAGLTMDFVQVVLDAATGIAEVGRTPSGEPCFTIPRPAAFDRVRITPQLREGVSLLKPDWLYFGTLLQLEPRLQRITEEFARDLPGIRSFYDINLRDGHWNFPLVKNLCRLASIVKMNEAEAKILADLSGMLKGDYSLEAFCRLWAQKYEIDSICVTLGEAGCCVYAEDRVFKAPGYSVTVQDTVGAGDAFAAGFLYGHHRGWPIMQIARFANALGSIVASRAGATPGWSVDECLAIASVTQEDMKL